MFTEPSTEHSAKYDQYAGRTIPGWVFGILNGRLNLPHLLEQGRPYRRITEWVERWDVCRVRDSPLISCSSLVRDTDEFVVWILDHHDGRWGVCYQSKNSIFGGGGTHDTLEEAIAAYDLRRGQQPEALTLF